MICKIYNEKFYVSLAFFFFASLFYLYNVHSTLSLIPIAGHDDGLFVHLAKKIVNGKWLGDFSQFTLMKGPGFPILLAFLNLLKIPINVFYAILIIFTCNYLRITLAKNLGNQLFPLFIVLLIMWYPGYDSIRILRNPFLVWMIILLLAILLDFYYSLNKQKIFNKKLFFFFALILGFVCLIREEWITYVIPILIILFVIMYSYFSIILSQVNSFKLRIKYLSVFIFLLFFPYILISFINLYNYGSFLVNDYKEKNFVETLKILQSVKTDMNYDDGFVFVPTDVRHKLYKLSPTFRELKEFLDDDNAPLLGWQNPSCRMFSETCGDYGGNWFFWALRDAVALNGGYNSPKKASDYYKKLNDEITGLCASKKITCKKKYTVLPEFNDRHISNIFKSIILSFKKITLISPPDLYNMPSMGSKKQLESYAKFLGLTKYTPSKDETELHKNKQKKIEIKRKKPLKILEIKLKKLLNFVYSIILPFIFTIGLLSFIFYVFLKKSKNNLSLILFLLWIIAFIRIILISIASEATHAVVNHSYLSFSGPIMILVSTLSIFIFLKERFKGKN